MKNKTYEDAKAAEKVWKSSYLYLPKLISGRNLRLGCEIGVAYGGHSESILKNTNSTLISIDPYKNTREYDDPMNVDNEVFQDIYEFAKLRLSKYGKRSKLLRLDSISAAKRISNIDYVYLDANHSYEGVIADLMAWFPKIKSGGIISGHDFNHPNFPGVAIAVNEFFERFGWNVNSNSSGFWWAEMKPLGISYVIPAFNCEDTLRDTVYSILESNITLDDEVIIVNDCSTDKTLDVANSLCRDNEQIKIINHRINRGGGSARNSGVMHATNSLIFCLDSDNILYPNSVSKLKSYLLSSNHNIVAFQELRYFKKSIKKVTHKWIFDLHDYSLKDILSTYIVPGASGNYLYTKNSYIKSGGYPEYAKALDAWGFGVRLAANSFTTGICKGTFYYHRYGHESYWVRESRSNNNSLLATQILLPYLSQLNHNDAHYILNKGLYSWFGDLEKRPIRCVSPDKMITLKVFFKMLSKLKRYIIRFMPASYK